MHVFSENNYLFFFFLPKQAILLIGLNWTLFWCLPEVADTHFCLVNRGGAVDQTGVISHFVIPELICIVVTFVTGVPQIYKVLIDIWVCSKKSSFPFSSARASFDPLWFSNYFNKQWYRGWSGQCPQGLCQVSHCWAGSVESIWGHRGTEGQPEHGAIWEDPVKAELLYAWATGELQGLMCWVSHG